MCRMSCTGMRIYPNHAHIMKLLLSVVAIMLMLGVAAAGNLNGGWSGYRRVYPIPLQQYNGWPGYGNDLGYRNYGGWNNAGYGNYGGYRSYGDYGGYNRRGYGWAGWSNGW